MTTDDGQPWGGLVESASNCAYCAVFPDLPCALHRNWEAPCPT